VISQIIISPVFFYFAFQVVGWGEAHDGKKFWIIRNSWGTYWGTMGFFMLERGTNALQIEGKDCWWAVPTWQDEQDVRSGVKVGTMWGIMTPEEAKKVIPEASKKPHKEDDPDDAGCKMKDESASAVLRSTADLARRMGARFEN
jgi:hypothetical protein